MGTTDTTPATPATAPAGGDFLAWLEEMRDRVDISWAEVSRRSGISENGLRKIRQGETTPRPATRDALASVFVSERSGDPHSIMELKNYAPTVQGWTSEGVMPPIPVRRGEGMGTVVLVLNVATPRASSMAPATAARLTAFLEQSARAWLLTADCDDTDD